MNDECDIADLVNNSNLNAKLALLATKADLKAEHDKIVKFQMDDLSYFRGKNFFDDDGFQNMCLSATT